MIVLKEIRRNLFLITELLKSFILGSFGQLLAQSTLDGGTIYVSSSLSPLPFRPFSYA